MRAKQRISLLISILGLAIFFSTTYAQDQRARQVPAPTAEVAVTISEQFPNAFLESIFTNLKAPSAALVITPSDQDRSPSESQACPSVITLQREEAGVRTAVKFEQERITAPLAFAGSYNSTLLGCLEFRGWASTTWLLEFDRSRQSLLARIRVDEIHLTNIPKLANGSLSRIVQTAIDNRINPIELLKLDQLSARVPIAPSNGALRLRAKEVRPEISAGNLQLHVVYEFVPDR